VTAVIRKWRRIILVGLAIRLAAPVAHAAAEGGTEGTVTFGTQSWGQSEPEAKFQEFREAPRGAFLEEFSLRTWNAKSLLQASGSNALREDQSMGLTWWRGARVRLDLDYRQVPHNLSFVARTPYTDGGGGRLLLPDSLQRSNEQSPSSYAARMTDLLNAAPRVGLGFRTDVARARLRARPAPGWQLELTGVQRHRSGRKPYGGPFGFNSAIEIVEPINQRMIDAGARVSYQRAGPRASLAVRGDAGVSAFENRVDAIVWDNPKRLNDRTSANAYTGGDGSAAGRLDLYPDNRSIHGDLAVALSLPRRTAVSMTVGIREDRQDDRWLPYTINTAILQPDSFPLPGTDTDGKARTVTQDYRVTSRPHRALGGTLRYRRYHYDNQTPEHEFAGSVRLDQAWQAVPATSKPHSFTNRNVGIDVDWSPVSRFGLSGTVEQIRRDRTHREVESDEETAWSLQARGRPARGVEGRVRYRRGERTLEHFVEEDYQNASGSFIEQPSLRRFDVANRVQRAADARLSWGPNEKIQLAATYGDVFNEYPDSDLGLRTERQQTAGGEIGGELSERVRVDAGYGWAEMESDQHSRESGGTLVQADSTNWRALLRDWSTYAYGSAELAVLPGKLTLETGYEFQRSPGLYDLTNRKGTALSLPGTKYRRQSAEVSLSYSWGEATRLTCRAAWEQGDVTDFASEEIPLLFPTTGATNAIFLGDSALDYRATTIALLLRRTF
jgi:MtrB/PioB family decaheme-associated outer membrane protein